MFIRKILNSGPLKHTGKIFVKGCQFAGGAYFSLQTLFGIGSAVDGEHTVNGVQKLTYSPIGYREKFESSPAVIFSLLDSGSASIKQILEPGSIIPCHADNVARGLHKLVHESKNATVFVAGAILGVEIITKKIFPQTLLVLGASTLFAAHRGNKTIGVPSGHDTKLLRNASTHM